MKNIALIGSTGSIGRQVVEVVKNHPDRFKIVAIAANVPSKEFERQKADLSPELAALASEDLSAALAVAETGDIVVNAAPGFSGLEYSLAAIRAGKRLALANKETLVCGGELFMREAVSRGAEILPVDSEHSALWQCMGFDIKRPVRRLVITASGGAFRGIPQSELAGVTPEQALAHPTWKMGKKITVDSATMLNKGYEIIEARHLFGVPYSAIEAVIQPQSTVHSLVEFEDGGILAQMSYPTMELPIQLALSYPERLPAQLKHMDFKTAFSLDFEPLKREDYPLFDLALKCGERGGAAPCALNAADEVAVAAFLSGKIRFTDIFGVCERVVSDEYTASDLETLKEVDRAARAVAAEEAAKLAK